MTARPSKYSDAFRAEITRLWSEGVSAGAIARRNDMTKNQVISLVHRLGLPKRPSPIGVRTDKSLPSRPRDAGASEKPPPAAALPPRIADLTRILGPRSGTPSPFKTCQWFERDNDGPFLDEDKCGRPSVRGKSYCPEHQRRSIVRRRAEEAA